MNALYNLAKPLAKIATRQFFREVHVIGHKPLENEPLIVVANHPNVMLDAFLVINSYQRVLWFIVKSTIFKGVWINWLLRSLHLIPIFRAQDRPDKMGDNEIVFQNVVAKLHEGGAVLIFPEGKSIALRKVQKLKTGAARIAFQAEKENDFSLGLKIQPVGITYSDFWRYNSSVTVHVGKPISVSDYGDSFKEEELEAVRKLTEDIEQNLKKVIVEVEDTELNSLVNKIAKLYRSRGLGQDDFQRIQAVATNVERVSPEFPEKAENIEKRVDLYLQFASSLKLDGSEAFDTGFDRVFLALISPFILIGVLTHIVPYQLISSLALKNAKARSQIASWGFSFAVIIFGIMYLAVLMAVYFASGKVSTAIIVCSALMMCGYYANRFFNQLSLLIFATLWPGHKTPVEVLGKMRDQLIEELEELRAL